MTTVTSGASTLTPLLVDGFRAERAAANLVHTIIGSNAPAVTLRTARLRTGTLNFLCADLTAALAIEALHAAASIVTLADTDLPPLGMAYIVSGSLTLEVDDSTRSRWWVRVEFQEVDS